MINCTCPNCQSGYSCQDDQAGNTFVCQVCRAEVPVPEIVTAMSLDEAPAPEPAEASTPAPAGPASPGRGGARKKPARQWYYEVDGEAAGPVSKDRLLAAAEDKALNAATLVWTDGMDGWAPAHEALPDSFDAPSSRWGVQQVIALVLATVAVASLLGLGGVYSAHPRGNRAEVARKPKDAPNQPNPAPVGRPAGNTVGPAAVPPKKDDRVLSAEEVGPRLLRSAVFIWHEDAKSRSCGSGTLIHKERRWVLTNYHVVETRDKVEVFFPDFPPGGGNKITDPKHYLETNRNKLRIWGKVIARNAKVDLAVIELDSVPESALVLPLAAKPADPGTMLYSIGGSGVNLRNLGGGMWRQSDGAARNRYRDTVNAEGQKIEAMFLETQKLINPGDSGGAAMNNRGELVGVVCLSYPGKAGVMLDIDLEEVQKYLVQVAKDNGWEWRTPAAPSIGPAPPASNLTDLIARATKSSNPDKQVEAITELKTMGSKARSAIPKLIPLLDDANDRVRRATASALEAIGEPAPEDLGAVVEAIKGKKPRAKLYALNHYASKRAERAQVPDLVASLESDDPEVREAALRAVSCYGPDCKADALEKLLQLLLDKDPAVSRLAVDVLVLFFQKFDATDRKLMVTNLSHLEPEFRYLSVLVLDKLTVDDQTALEWFRPRLTDPSAEVRASAIAALARRKVGARSAVDELLKRTEDNILAVQIAAIRALGDIGGPKVVPGLAKFLGPATDPRVHSAAARALTQVEFSNPDSDLPVLVPLLAESDPSVRVAALNKLASFGAAGLPLLKQIVNGLDDPEAVVRDAALKAASAIGPAVMAAAAKAKPGEPAKQAPDELSKKVAEMVTKKFDTTLVAQPGGTNEPLTQRLTRSAVWVYVEDKSGRSMWNGAGVLVNAGERLVLTTHHIGHQDYVPIVFFPHWTNGVPQADPAFYLNNAAKLAGTRHAQVGRVVWSKPELDLALIQFDQAPPPDSRAITLAGEPAQSGTSLYAVGHSRAGLWKAFSPGKASPLGERTVTVNKIQTVKCQMLETGWVLDDEDSGGAVTNDRGELVGLNFARVRGDRIASYALDLSVLRAAPKFGAAAPSTAESTPRLALDALTRLGKPGGEKLTGLLTPKPSNDIRNAIFDRLALLGADLPDEAATRLLEIAQDEPETRNKIQATLILCGNDAVSLAFRTKYKWEMVTKFKRKDNADVTYHRWLLKTMGEVQVANMSDPEKKKLRDYLKDHGEKDPDAECKALASRARSRLDVLLVPKK